MQKGVVVCLTGANVADAAKALAVRLAELGRNVERFDDSMVERLGGLKRAGFVSELLARNGVIVVGCVSKLRPGGERLDIALSAHDTPDFAAEKILDDLAAAGAVSLESTDYSPEEEEQIRKRLADLGYIE